MTRLLASLSIIVIVICIAIVLVAQTVGRALPPEDEVVYSANVGNTNFEIYRRILGRGISVQLTFTLTNDTSPDWSPDGQHIVFVGEESNNSVIYIMDNDGRNIHIMSAPINGDQDNPVWSPDGQSIAYVFYQKPDHIKYNPQVMLFDLRTQTYRYLTSNYNISLLPNWSPDSSQVAFIADTQSRAAFDIMTVNIKSGDSEPLTDTPRDEFSPAWSPDGRYIAHEGNFENGIYLLDTSTLKSNLLYPMAVSSYMNGWSSDSQYIIFTEQDKDQMQHIFKLNVADCLQKLPGCVPDSLFPEPKPGSYAMSRWRPRQP